MIQLEFLGNLLLNRAMIRLCMCGLLWRYTVIFTYFSFDNAFRAYRELRNHLSYLCYNSTLRRNVLKIINSQNWALASTMALFTLLRIPINHLDPFKLFIVL